MMWGMRIMRAVIVAILLAAIAIYYARADHDPYAAVGGRNAYGIQRAAHIARLIEEAKKLPPGARERETEYLWYVLREHNRDVYGREIPELGSEVKIVSQPDITKGAK